MISALSDVLQVTNAEIAETLHKVALAQKTRGNASEAERGFRQAMEMRKKFLGQRHMLIAFDLESIAGTLWSQGKLEAAEQHFRDSMEMRRELLGPTHPELARSCHYLGWVLMNHNPAEAEQLLREALSIRRQREFPPNHPYVAQNLHLLGMLLVQSERLEEAVEVFQESYDIRAEHLPSYLPGSEDAAPSATPTVLSAGGMAMEPMDRITVAQDLTRCLLELGDYERAEPLAREVYYGRKALLGERDGATRQALTQLINLYRSLGNADQLAQFEALQTN